MSDNKLETGMEQLLAWSNMQEELNDIDFSEGFSIDDLPHKEVDKILPEAFDKLLMPKVAGFVFFLFQNDSVGKVRKI